MTERRRRCCSRRAAASAFAAIEEKIRANTAAVLEAARAAGVSPRQAAVELATARVVEAMGYRRFSIL